MGLFAVSAVISQRQREMTYRTLMMVAAVEPWKMHPAYSLAWRHVVSVLLVEQVLPELNSCTPPGLGLVLQFRLVAVVLDEPSLKVAEQYR